MSLLALKSLISELLGVAKAKPQPTHSPFCNLFEHQFYEIFPFESIHLQSSWSSDRIVHCCSASDCQVSIGSRSDMAKRWTD
jgi:hypothetical protein